MGDAQSAQREISTEAAGEEERGAPEDARVDHSTEDKSLINNGQISEINGKADSTIAEVDDHRGDAIAAEASLSPEEDVLQTVRPLKEERSPSDNVEINQKESPEETDAIEELPLEMTEMDAKQNDINESFKRFFSNIGLKLTVKRGSVEKDEITADAPDETNKNESDRPENTDDTADEPESVKAESNIDQKTQGTYDNDSTTCPTLTDVTSEDTLENAEEKTTEAKEVVESEAATPSPVVEDLQEQKDATLEEEDLHTPSTASPEAEEVVSPVKRFFTTGIFSGLRKKKKSTGDETTEKELVDMGGKETEQKTEKTVEVQQDKDEIGQGVEATTVEREHIEKEPKEEIISTASAQPMNDGESPPAIPATITVNEPDMSSQDKVQDSPMKWFLSGSSLRKLSKKQRGRKSSNTMLSDSEEHLSDQLMSPTKPAETQKEERPEQHSAEAAVEEDGAWASFKKLVTPKKHMKKSSLTSEETPITGSVEETKPSEKGQISDHSTEEGKKRKDSSVSWEAVLCGSGRRRSRSRKTSDSEDESPQVENDNKKRQSPLGSSNEVDETVSPNVGSPSEGDGGSTWKSFKKLVTPKRKAKDEVESKDNIQSDSESHQDDSSFSIKKLLPRKKKKSSENQDQVSSDEAEKEVVSSDEDSETPAVIPLSEFDTIETEVHIKTEADVESDVAKEADDQLQQDLCDQTSQPVLPCDGLQPEVKKVQEDKDTFKNETSTALASNEEPEDLTELISKHQQLSDIPEEGIITETNATPASVPEEPAPDDTIAEDLIEITSEAVTAPEPVDITTADETEMISAVSQLSESSNTSGNTTPVPVEYEVKPTEDLLHQVVESISLSPNVVPVCSDEVNSERIVGSVLHQILETFVKEEPTILQIHGKSDAASISIGLNVEELEMINKLTTTAQIEGISEVHKSVSTEIVSNAPTKEVVTAEMAVDEVHEVNVSHPEERINELEINNVSQHLVKTQSEANEAGSLEILPEGGAAVEDEGSLLGANQDEKEPQEMNSQEVQSTATVSEESKDGGVEEEDQTQIIDQVQVESQDQPVESDLQESPAVSKAMLDSEEGSGHFIEKEVIKEDITAEVTDKPREDTEPNAEFNVEAEKETKLQAGAAQTEHTEDPDVLESVLTTLVDMQEGSGQLLENEVLKIKDIPAEEMVRDKPQEETESVTEYNVEAEKETKLQAASVETEDAKEPKMLETEQTLDSEDGSAQLLENEAISERTPAEEMATDKRQEEKVPLTENNVETETESTLQDSVKTEHAEEPEASVTLDSEEGSIQLLEKKVTSDNIPAEEAAADKEDTKSLTECNVETETESKLQEDSVKTEHAEEPEAIEPEQTASLDSEEGSAQLHEKQVISEVTPAEETVTDTPQEKTDPAKGHVETENESKLQADSGKTEHAEEPEALVTLDSEEGSIQLLEKKVTLDDIPAEEAAADKEDTKSLTECNVEEETEHKLQADAAKTEHAEEPEALEAEQTASLDSEEGGVQSPEKEETREEIPAETTATDKPKGETEPGTECNVEAEEETKLEADSAKTEHAKEVVALETTQAASLDAEDSVQLPQEEVSEDNNAAETVTEETKQQATENQVDPREPENKELKTDTPNIEHHKVPEVSGAVQVSKLDSEEGSVQSLEIEVTPETTIEAETITDEPKEETEPLTEVIEPVDAFKTEHVQELVQEPVLEDAQAAMLDSEEGSAQSLEKEVISEQIPPEETVAHEVARAAEGSAESELSGEDAKTEHVQEPEVLPADVNDTATETEPEVEASTPAHVVQQGSEESSAPNPEPTDSVTVEGETKVVADLNQDLSRNEDQEAESTPQDVHVGQEDQIPEAVDEIQTITAVHVSSVNNEASSAQVSEINVFSEVTPTPCVENVTVSLEPIHEVHLSSVQSSVEEERGQIRGLEVKSAPVQHAIVAQVITCYLKDNAAAIPDTLIETTSDSCEPLIDSVASELGFNETNETTTPLVKNYVTKTGEEGSVVKMMNVPSVQFEDNHRIQVQVVDVDVKSATMIVDTVLEVGVTETKEVMDMCHETVKEVDKLSATLDSEEIIRSEENKVTIQEVIQHVRENLPETVPESELVNTEQEVIKETDVVAEKTEIPESESSEVEDQKVVEDDIVTCKERQDEGCDVINDDSTKGFENLMQTPDIPERLDVLIHDPKEDLEKPEAEVKKSEADVSTTDVKKKNEEAQTPQIEIVTANTGLVVPQNTGVISSVGNVEPPSSLSIEFKFNIQFGHAKEPASPPPSTERTEPMKQTVVAEVCEVVEPKEEINPAHSEERQKQTEVTEVTVQGTEVTQAANLDSTESPVIINQPVLLDVGMQTVEIVEPVDQIKSTERGTPNVQAKETIQTVRQKEKRGVFLSQPLLSEVCEQETKAEEPVKHTEEENDQDVWMDAEEDINNQEETEMSLHEVQEPPEHQAISDQEETVALEAAQEFEMADSRIEGEESQGETLEKGETCETESEGEDFAVALEDPENATANIMTMEWD
ncbi:A-kinase anchor protein 12 [Paralichthys olivaceus]|uniref:A-kinase anchor protein 12 n=1 Tax=Paralichthys olivaceus TaxID=8255 RepID=UPI003750B4B5